MRPADAPIGFGQRTVTPAERDEQPAVRDSFLSGSWQTDCHDWQSAQRRGRSLRPPDEKGTAGARLVAPGASAAHGRRRRAPGQDRERQAPADREPRRQCDAVFPERRGWFTEYYEESRHWSEVPASFKSWPEYEDKAASLRDWSPSIMTGLLQTEEYARALLSVQPQISQETVAARLASRMERQKRVLMPRRPPSAWFVVDELSLYREVGAAEVMAAQLRHLLEVAAMPTVTIQVLPAVAHPVNASGFLMADDAVWIEHAAGGFVYTERGNRFSAGTPVR